MLRMSPTLKMSPMLRMSGLGHLVSHLRTTVKLLLLGDLKLMRMLNQMCPLFHQSKRDRKRKLQDERQWLP